MAKKIMIVDDDLYIRELYEEILKSEGYITDTAKDGNETLTKLQQGGYDLILLDIMMPFVDGLQIMDVLKKNPPVIPNGPIILLTNLDKEAINKDAINRGAAAIFIKSDMTPDQLIAQVKTILKEDITN